MALSVKLELRQGQSLVMTPQLQQAIKLLQLSNLEITEYVEQELERNPLLERDEREEPGGEPENRESGDDKPETGNDEPDNWLNLSRNETQMNAAGDLDSNYEDTYPDAAMPAPGHTADSGWASLRQVNHTGDGSGVDLEAFVAETISLRDHLTEQMSLAIAEPKDRMIARHLIDMVDEAGYLRGDIDKMAERLGAPLDLVEDTLARLQTFEPAGVFARDIGECLIIQLRESGKLTPELELLIENIGLLASHKIAELKRAVGQSDDNLAALIVEIKKLNPKPGLIFGSITVQPVVPDVFLRQLPDGTWLVELNSDTLPKLLVNRSYYATVSKSARSEDDKNYLSECIQTANWLVKSLDQRARTILKVSREIVRQQDAFFTHGIAHLRPLNLKTVADAISMHESTVSRVTSNKYMATNRGIFELKYFFTSAISASGNGEALSSEAVRHKIRQVINNEAPDKVLSDDKIVALLQDDGVEIARRTVAKYREAMRIPSSVQRRREKKLAWQNGA